MFNLKLNLNLNLGFGKHSIDQIIWLFCLGACEVAWSLQARLGGLHGFYVWTNGDISVHLSPCFRDTAIGDTLTVVECRY